MERISIFNYEAFYLDYLEGKLSEEDTAMLMAFFEDHPECKLDDEELPVMTDFSSMTFTGKDDLKQVDETDAISLTNAEHFMIADTEGLLTDAKREELNSFVAAHPETEADRDRYAAVYFTPDNSMVYGDKAGLKRRKAIILWPYVSFAAAAAVISFIFLWNGGTEQTLVDPTPNSGFANNTGGNGTVPVTPVANGDENENVDHRDVVVDPNGVQVYQADMGAERPSPNESLSNKPRVTFANLEVLPVRELDVAQENRNHPIGRTVLPISTPKSTDSNDEVEPYYAFTNPIEPITKFISEKTRTEVDYRQADKKKDKKRGFYIKIGKLEIARR